MGHRYVEHVGELELELESSSERGLFAEALTAFRELVDDTGVHGPPLRRDIELPPEESALLLADWLGELIFLAETHAFVPRRVIELDLHGGGLRATVEGERGRPRHLVKAVTLEHLDVSQREGRWHGRLVLDV